MKEKAFGYIDGHRDGMMKLYGDFLLIGGLTEDE